MMPWFLPHVPERVCKYLLQRYLGQFFEEKLTLDQLSVDLYNGKGTVEKVSLDVQALNEITDKQNWPFEFLDGYLSRLCVSVPWTCLLKESSYIEVHGLRLTLQPKQRKESATSMFESMWSSMTNSMQLAQDCISQESGDGTADSAQLMEGIEKFAQVIDSILSRVKVKFINTTIRIEHMPQDSLTGIALQIDIDSMDYLDEAGNDPPTGETPENSQEQSKAYILTSFTTKTFRLEGVSFSTVEFPCSATACSQYTMNQSIYTMEKDSEDSLASFIKNREEKSRESDESPDDDQMQTVVFGKLCAKQEIRVRMKQSENVSGPKVFIEVNLGPLLLFLSPRQLHVLLELAKGLAVPASESEECTATKQKCAEKPMGALDYQRIEHELQQQLHPFSNLQAGGLQGGAGWATGLEESDDDIFLPMKNPTSSGMFDSVISGTGSSMESSFTSSVTSSVSESTIRMRRRVNNIESDPTAEISHFQIRLASLAAILLHEDILAPSMDYGECLIPSSVKQMQTTAAEFFNQIGPYSFLGLGNKDFDNSRKKFEAACKLNHLRLLAARIQIEAKETTTMTAFSISGKLTVSRMQLLECLGNDKGGTDYVTVLSFDEPIAGDQSEVAVNPCMKLTFKHIEKTTKSGTALKRGLVPKTDVSVWLDTCTAELDVTIVDRIVALLNPQPVCKMRKKQSNPWLQDNQKYNSSSQADSKLDLKVSSGQLTLRLRFPIPDFRPPHDMHKTPWWKRNVRPDFLSFQFQDLAAETSFQNSVESDRYTLKCRGVTVSYCENEMSFPTPIAKAGADGNGNLCRLSFVVHPVKLEEKDVIEYEFHTDAMYQSLYGALGRENLKPHGPFSSKKVIHESDTAHGKKPKDSSEELIIPGTKAELDKFVKDSTDTSRIVVDLSLPTVSLQLLSKHIYEVIYNRINNDLLLWEPSAPKPKQSNYERFTGAANFAMEQDTFAMCKSGIQYESDSSSEEETDPEMSSVFYSLSESRAKHKFQVPPVKCAKQQNCMTINMEIGQGLLCLNPPVRDLALNVRPGQQSEFYMTVAKARVSIINGYEGDEDLGYVCVQVHDAQLHHCDMMSAPSQSPPLKEIGSSPGAHLFPTIYKSEQGVLASSNNNGGDRELVSIAIRIQASHETHHVKTVRVAVGINKATLRHRMCSEPNDWISHIADFFNVTDYPIPGYLPKEVLTELHLHLWDCAIDYRPLHLPLRTVITMGDFSMSFHLAAQTNVTTLRFIAEECAVFLSDKVTPKAVDLRRDYICVIDFGLFELSLRTADKKSGISPHVDLRASNDVLHIRTCADSARALTQLIVYYASNGDLTAKEDSSCGSGGAGSVTTSPRHPATEPQLVNVDPQHFSNLSNSQHEQVNDLLGEALKESYLERKGEENLVLTDADPKMFFFPDENSVIDETGRRVSSLSVADTSEDVTYYNKTSDTDDEFCFLGEDPLINVMPKDGEPIIRWLTDEPIRIADNYFTIPVDRSDVLRAPKSFPQPLMRYTLCDMSIVWHMYGGTDFTDPTTSDGKKKSVNFADLQVHGAIGYAKTRRGGDVVYGEIATEKKRNRRWQVPWRQRGGDGRDHDVLMELQLNKVRFQHEVYPDTAREASRQVVVVSEVEVRDRLAESQINKFLYQYTSQKRPKQTHAHMVVIKLWHIRPDPKLKREESCLKISLLPLRLNIDQDALLFLIKFFNDLSGDNSIGEDDENAPKHSTPTHHPPIMTVATESDDDIIKQQAEKMVGENLMLLLEENKCNQEVESSNPSNSGRNEDTPPLYFRYVRFYPEVPIRLDYHGKRVDLTHGPWPGILMGLGQLNCSELRLCGLLNRHGILGVDRLVSYLVQEWVNHIKKNQLPGLLGGFGPMHSLVQLFQGIRDLFWLPIEQYQKDGRIVRGLQKGANSFTTSTAMAALELTSRIVHLIQITAETAYDMLSPGPSVRRLAKKGKRKRYNQPQDIREGMANAFHLVKEGIGETAENIVKVASHEHEQKGYSGAVGGVLRQIPPTIFKPIIIASEATSNVLGGMRSQLVPDARREANQKWRSDDS